MICSCSASVMSNVPRSVFKMACSSAVMMLSFMAVFTAAAYVWWCSESEGVVRALLEQGVGGDLVNAKVDPKRIEQIDFILKYFPVVKCLKNHVKIDFFRWRYFERFSRFVGESPHVLRVHTEEFNDLVEEGLFVPQFPSSHALAYIRRTRASPCWASIDAIPSGFETGETSGVFWMTRASSTRGAIQEAELFDPQTSANGSVSLPRCTCSLSTHRRGNWPCLAPVRSTCKRVSVACLLECVAALQRGTHFFPFALGCVECAFAEREPPQICLPASARRVLPNHLEAVAGSTDGAWSALPSSRCPKSRQPRKPLGNGLNR